MKNLHDVALRYRTGLDITSLSAAYSEELAVSDNVLVAFIRNVHALGYVPSFELVALLRNTDGRRFKKWACDALRAMQEVRGAQYSYNPMYPNFPKQVATASDTTLFVNAITHYFGEYLLGAEILPAYEKEERFPFCDDVKYQILKPVRGKDLTSITENLVAAKVSYSEADINALTLLGTSRVERAVSKLSGEKIANKENYATVTKILRSSDTALTLIRNVQTGTDLLRIVAVFSDAHPSLSERFKVGKLSRPERKAVVDGLNTVSNTLMDAFKRDSEQWKRVLERLHLSEYVLDDATVEAVQSLRNQSNLFTWSSRVEKAISEGNVLQATKLLAQRPGEFARRMNTLLHPADSDEVDFVLSEFKKVADKVSTTVLWQLYAWTQTIIAHPEEHYSTVFPNGVNASGFAVLRPATNITSDDMKKLDEIVFGALNRIYAARPTLGAVYYEHEAGYNPAMPFGMRNSSTSMKSVGRASRFSFDVEKTLRFFIHWKGAGVDLDLSASFMNESFENIYTISYYNLREAHGYHSGDIITAPRGASEFIDVNVGELLKDKKFSQVRYIAMTVHAYSDVEFNKVQECFAGFMLRDDVNSGEIYEPKSVNNAFLLNSDSRVVIPFVFDLKTGEAVWTDVTVNQNLHRYGAVRNVATTSRAMHTVLSGMFNRTPVQVQEVVALNVLSRCTKLVETPEEADTVVRLRSDDQNTVNLDEVISTWL